MQTSLGEEVIKALPIALFNIVAICFAWLVGKRLTLYWSVKQKARELSLEARKELHFLYGEFFATWKLWEYTVHQKHQLADFADRRWNLLERISLAEGKVEGIVTQVASVRGLAGTEIASLGCFRQSYQRLRRAIRDEVTLGWKGGDDPNYLDFKKHAAEVSVILAQSSMSPEKVARAFQNITSTRWNGQKEEPQYAQQTPRQAKEASEERQEEDNCKP
jgi:hypothetical protein